MKPINFYIGLFLITGCTLMLQIIQTRILSVVAWYHLAFLAISMAMFGLTAGAVWVYLRSDRFTEKTLSYDLAYYSTAFALSTAVCLAVQTTIPLIVSFSLSFVWMWLELALTIAIPFFFSGVVVSLALTRSPFPIGRVYAVDLIGAALGCIGVLLLLNNTDGPSAILWVAVIGIASAMFFANSAIGNTPSPTPAMHGPLMRRKTILSCLIVFALVNGSSGYGLQPLVVKGKFEGGGSYLLREWNSFSRVALTWEKEGPPKMWGPSTKLPADLTVVQRNLNIDGGASTGAYRFTGDLSEVDFLRYDITNLTYHLPGRESAAVIGVGGGRDVISAALFGYSDITGVELNPIFIELLTERPGFADFTNVNSIDGIKFYVDDGRSWFARTDQQFDLIQMSLIDTWAATGAGAFSLSENGLYTVEAWKIFLDRLTPIGVYTVSRWHDEEEPTESARTVSLAVAALLDMGVEEPDRHIYLVTSGRVANIMVAREPFSAADLKALDDAAAVYDFRILASPNHSSEYEIFRNILSSRSPEELHDYTSGLLYDLTPATDDRPFFFNQLPLNKPIQAFKIAKSNIGARRMTGGVRQGNIVATATLLVLFFVCLLLVTATIVIPLRPALKDVGKKFVTGGTLYFLLIGIGFMMAEIGLLMRMSVFLGHPIYSLSVLLFTLILSTGLGSLLSDKLALDSKVKFTGWAIITSAYILSLPIWLPGLLLDFDGASLMSRVSLCIATITPAGLLMGFGFPTGMRLVTLVDRKPTPWFWGINGAAGVLASVAAVSTSISMGISMTITIGAICYLLLIPVTLTLMWTDNQTAAPA